MQLKQRYAKRVYGSQDYESILNENYERNRVGMSIQFSSDMQNPFSYHYDRRDYLHEMCTVIIRFINKRIGRKFDDVYSEFCEKYVHGKYKNIHGCREEFLNYIKDNKNNIYVVDGVIQKVVEPLKSKDIVIYKQHAEWHHVPQQKAWAAGRRLLIPLIGYNKFKYYSSNFISDDDYDKLVKLLSKKINNQILDEFNTIQAFHREVTKYFDGISLRTIMIDLFYRDYYRPIERVIKYNTPEYWEYKRQIRKKYKKVYDPEVYDKDLKEHNIKESALKPFITL